MEEGEGEGSCKILGVKTGVSVFFSSLTSGGLSRGAKKMTAATMPEMSSRAKMVETTTTTRPLGWRCLALGDGNLRTTMPLI